MICTPSPFPLAVLAEADKIAPGRRRTSDGICGDVAHQAEVSDHNPDSRGIPHAVDISQSIAGNPFGDGVPPRNLFDAHAYGDLIAQRIIDGTETRVKYLVSHNYRTGSAKIFNPSIGLVWWRDQPGDNHLSHLHVSFLYQTWVEQSTAPFFQPTPEDDMPLNATDLAEVRTIVRQELAATLGGASTVPPSQTIVDVVKHYAQSIIETLKP